MRDRAIAVTLRLSLFTADWRGSYPPTFMRVPLWATLGELMTAVRDIAVLMPALPREGMRITVMDLLGVDDDPVYGSCRVCAMAVGNVPDPAWLSTFHDYCDDLQGPPAPIGAAGGQSGDAGPRGARPPRVWGPAPANAAMMDPTRHRGAGGPRDLAVYQRAPAALDPRNPEDAWKAFHILQGQVGAVSDGHAVSPDEANAIRDNWSDAAHEPRHLPLTEILYRRIEWVRASCRDAGLVTRLVQLGGDLAARGNPPID